MFTHVGQFDCLGIDVGLGVDTGVGLGVAREVAPGGGVAAAVG